MSGDIGNPLLRQAEANIEGQLTPENHQNYLKIVVAGMHAALDKGPNGILASLRQSKDPISDAAKGAVAMVIVLRKEARGVMPFQAMVPAAMTLTLKALDFVSGARIANVGQPELVRATHIFTDAIFSAFGISKAGLADAASRVHALTQDPAALQKINAKAAAGHDEAMNG